MIVVEKKHRVWKLYAKEIYSTNIHIFNLITHRYLFRTKRVIVRESENLCNFRQVHTFRELYAAYILIMNPYGVNSEFAPYVSKL